MNARTKFEVRSYYCYYLRYFTVFVFVLAAVFANKDIHGVREKRGHSILGITLTNLDTVS